SVVDGDGGPTRLTQSTTYTLSSTGFAKFYSDAAGDNPITQITLAPGADISAVTPSQTIFYLNTAAASPQTITASFSSGNNLGTGTNIINVTTGAATMLQVLMPGETAAPGTSTVKTGTPAAQIAGNNIMVTINAVDENWNLVSTATPTVKITASDDNAELPDNTALTAGTRTFLVTFKTAGNHTVTATDQSEGESLTENIGSETAVSAGVASKLQILMPGETAAPGTPNGKTGTAADQIAGVAFDLIVNVVDANWNLVTTATGKAAKLTSSDPLSSLGNDSPLPDALLNLSSGTSTTSIKFKTAGHQFMTATELNSSLSAGDGTSILVNPGTVDAAQATLTPATAT